MRKIGKDVIIHPDAEIDVGHLEIGDYSVINKGVSIKGRKVILGRYAWLDEGSRIGGGRADMGTAKIGDFFHLGKNAEINTARDVIIGDEVGIGMDSKIVTHGAYLNRLKGFPYKVAPIKIGSHVWIPFAWVLPGVKIGDCVVVGAMSLVNKDIPSHSLAAGNPAKIIRSMKYFSNYKPSEREIQEATKDILKEAKFYGIDDCEDMGGTICLKETCFDLVNQKITGFVTEESEKFRNILRRHGIRFYYGDNNGIYEKW